jgi:hypothetical protein
MQAVPSERNRGVGVEQRTPRCPAPFQKQGSTHRARLPPNASTDRRRQSSASCGSSLNGDPRLLHHSTEPTDTRRSASASNLRQRLGLIFLLLQYKVVDRTKFLHELLRQHANCFESCLLHLWVVRLVLLLLMVSPTSVSVPCTDDQSSHLRHMQAVHAQPCRHPLYRPEERRDARLYVR